MSLQFYFILLTLFLFAFLPYLYIRRNTSYDLKNCHTQKVMELPNYSQIDSSLALCTIKIEDLKFRARIYNLQGKGEAIILLHGWPQSSIAWQPFFEAAKNLDYKIIAYDQRGYSPGARPINIKDYTTAKLVADVFDIADELNIERFHLVGHDWGAAIGWAAVMSNSKRILSWTALSIPHSLAFFEALRTDKEQQKKSLYIKFFNLPWLPEFFLALGKVAILRLLMFKWMPKSHTEEYLSILSEPGAMSATLNWYRAMKLKQDFDYHADIKVPVLFIWGNRDPAISRAAILKQDQYIHGTYKNIELDTGHWLLERRTKFVIHEILEHIKNV